MSTAKLRNIGPKSAAWLRQVGLHTQEDLVATGAVAAFVKVRRAGFKPSLNLLYSLEGALVGCHWQELPAPRRQQLVEEYEAIIAEQPLKRAGPAAGPVYSTQVLDAGEDEPFAADDD
ncbi:TfoX/Sxy family protein [Flavobacterium sp. MXW15]|uniref:TfoX/Sxy family protein n=1 Tax=Xanthomonas chitinilytica TaxID=2989819 RepID=A0ABT3JT06_9XANT|nr:TfoX/Sxy family protein [Xanthomonas sp. H13-6]MCW4454333.1 TfoX/Sxy family protein [Flavobacterium sp. MXW15]MCW4471565.1 TfoX/Sxy family protein [Xanthomonas sp. H13-6]